MELRQLRYVEAVERHRHFTRAAEELHVAQSALSHQVRRLEAELGVRLFERTSRRVVATEAGEVVAARARHVLREVDAVGDELDALRGLVRGRITVGALLPAGEVSVTALLAEFSHARPGIEVSLREGTAGEMLELVRREEVDATFSLIAEALGRDLEAVEIGREEVVAAFPRGEAPTADRLRAEDLSGAAVATPRAGSAIKVALEEFMRAGRGELAVSLESGDPYLIRCLVSDGFGPAILPASIADREGPPVEIRPLSPSVSLPVALVRKRSRVLSAAAADFVEFVLARAAEP